MVAEIMRSLLSVTMAERTVRASTLLEFQLTVSLAIVFVHHGAHMGGYRCIT